MDNIHEISKKPWILNRQIKLGELIIERQLKLQQRNIRLNEDNDISRGSSSNNNNSDGVNCTNGSSDSRYTHKELELFDELDKFVKQNEDQVKPYFLFNTTDERSLVDEPQCKLKTYQLQFEHAKKLITDRAYKVSYLMKLKTTRRELLMRHLASTNKQSSPSRPLPSDIRSDTAQCTNRNLSAIVVVQTWPQPNKTSKVRLEREILFHSDQRLTELRDQFKCQHDFGVPMELSDNPEQGERIFRGELFKSGFFLIENTFYNDMRDPNNIDLSADIIEWASKEVFVRGTDGRNMKVARGLGPFESVKMEDVTFRDLQFRLGCPYFYLHQGDCEHLFTISDIRYIADDLKLWQLSFPIVTASALSGKMNKLRCYMCRSRPPHWYTRNNNRLPIDPFFFCENCFYSFNYDKEKKKIGHFQAYLYTSLIGIPNSVVMDTR